MSDTFEHGTAADHETTERPEQNKREHASGEPGDDQRDRDDADE
jgi:hypothetical protein